MTTKNFIQLVNIPDYRYDSNCSNISYDDIAEDCDSKTISLLQAISQISLNIMSMSEEKKIDKDKILSLSGVISDLSGLAIATNKISQTASYLSGVQSGNHGA